MCFHDKLACTGRSGVAHSSIVRTACQTLGKASHVQHSEHSVEINGVQSAHLSAHFRAFIRAFPRISAHLSAHFRAFPRISAHFRAFIRAFPRISAHFRAFPRIYPRISAHLSAHSKRYGILMDWHCHIAQKPCVLGSQHPDRKSSTKTVLMPTGPLSSTSKISNRIATANPANRQAPKSARRAMYRHGDAATRLHRHHIPRIHLGLNAQHPPGNK